MNKHLEKANKYHTMYAREQIEDMLNLISARKGPWILWILT